MYIKLAFIIAGLLILAQPVLSKPVDGVASRDNQKNSPTAHKAQGLEPSKPVNISNPKTKVRSPPTRESVNLLIKWIVSRTGWQKQSPPVIQRVSKKQMMKSFLGRNAAPGPLIVEGLYTKKNRTIYLLDKWDSNSLHDQSVLVHELVHHLQFLNDIPATCPQQYNLKAYALQFAWLREQGIRSPNKYIGIDDFTIMAVSLCPYP